MCYGVIKVSFAYLAPMEFHMLEGPPTKDLNQNIKFLQLSMVEEMSWYGGALAEMA